MSTDYLRKRVAEATTPPPWTEFPTSAEWPGVYTDEDEALAVAAVNALPALLDVVEAARKVLAAVDHPEPAGGVGECSMCDLDDALSRLDTEGMTT